MSVGFLNSGICHASASTAAAYYCSSFGAADSSGKYSYCSAVSNPTIANNIASFNATVKSLTPALLGGYTTNTLTAPVSLVSCEVQDWAYWSPLVGAWAAALVAVLAAKTIYRKVFDRETI
jgi:hypothetical protein